MRNYRGAAKKRGMTWNISEDQFVSLINGDCHWCGVEPQPRTDKQFRGDVANGVDRVDNTRGYEPDNVVSCCSTCNRAKGALSEQEFLDWVYRVALHHYDQVRSSP
jgi:hypothetical protein